jgi:hypothetical protein
LLGPWARYSHEVWECKLFDDGNVPGVADESGEERAPIEIDNPDVVASAKRMYGRGGMFLAAGMLGLEKILQEKKKTESVQVQESASEPVDVDADGITLPIDDSTTVNAPPLEPRAPVTGPRRKPRRR